MMGGTAKPTARTRQAMGLVFQPWKNHDGRYRQLRHGLSEHSESPFSHGKTMMGGTARFRNHARQREPEGLSAMEKP